MKLLLFSDLHCSRRAAANLVEMAKSADVLLGAGDFGAMRSQVGRAIEVLKVIEKPAVLVAGNAESAEELTAACEIWPTAHVLHGNGITIDGIDFWGIGGGIPVTPFGSWSWDFNEDQARELLADCPSNAVLVSHSPPKGLCDSTRGQHLGSTAIRDFIDEKTPRLVVCGHIHAAWEQQAQVDKTRVINAGPQGILIDLD